MLANCNSFRPCRPGPEPVAGPFLQVPGHPPTFPRSRPGELQQKDSQSQHVFILNIKIKQAHETNLCNGSLGLRALGSGSAATIPGSAAAATMHVSFSSRGPTEQHWQVYSKLLFLSCLEDMTWKTSLTEYVLDSRFQSIMTTHEHHRCDPRHRLYYLRHWPSQAQEVQEVLQELLQEVLQEVLQQLLQDLLQQDQDRQQLNRHPPRLWLCRQQLARVPVRSLLGLPGRSKFAARDKYSVLQDISLGNTSVLSAATPTC